MDGDESLVPGRHPWRPTPVHATVTVPGSKSQTNRALVLAALATAAGHVDHRRRAAQPGHRPDDRGAADARAYASTATATDLTVGGAIDPGPGAHGRLRPGGHRAAVRAAGRRTGAETVTFDGDEQARARPIAPLLDALRGLGVGVDGDGAAVPGAAAPDRSPAAPSRSTRRRRRSSSRGCCCRGPSFTDGLTVRAHRRVGAVGAAHRDDGGDAARGRRRRRRLRTPTAGGSRPARSRRGTGRSSPTCPTPCRSLRRRWSPAARCASPGWPAVSVQPADDILDMLAEAGCHCRANAIRISRCTGSDGYGGFDVDLHDVGELTPSVAALAALADAGSVSRLERHRPSARPRDRPARRADAPRSTASAVSARRRPTAW